MKKFTRQAQGSISLFLSMIILLLVILEGFLIDGSKILSAKIFLSSAGDMAMNAGLTYYDEALRDIYGLFAFSENEADLKENLKKHFQKTIGEAAGDVDQGYVDGLMTWIDESIRNGWSGQEAGTLIGLELGNFDAGGVAGSELSNPYVIKAQILEYMKYRGPASLGYGLLEKLYTFKDLSKQQDTMEKKLDYEEKMSDIQKACQNAYENIKPYNELLDGVLAPDAVEAKSLVINRNIRESIIAVWCLSAASRDFSLEINWKKDTGSSAINVEQAVKQCSLLNTLCVLSQQAESRLRGDFPQHAPGAMDSIKVILGYREEYPEYCNLYTVWENYKEYYKETKEDLEDQLDGLDDEEDESEIEAIERELDRLEDEYDEYRELYENAAEGIDGLPEPLALAKTTLTKDIDDRMKDAVSDIKLLYENSENLKELAENGSEELDNVITAMKELEERGKKWQESIGELSEGDIRTSMQSDYDNKAKELDEDIIRELQRKLTNGQQYASELLTAIAQTKAVNVSLHDSAWGNYTRVLKTYFEASVYGNDTNTNAELHYSGFSSEFWTDSANNTPALTDESCTVFLKDSTGGRTEGGGIQMNLSSYRDRMGEISAKEDEFYKYLERVCPERETDKESKAEAQEEKRLLLEKAQEEDTKPEGAIGSLPGDVTGASGGKTNKYNETGSNADDKAVSKTVKENTRSSVSFLEGVEGLLESGRDKLYISEYSIEMFSYYTVDKMEQVENRVQKTLSGMPLNAENNKMYRAEAEYILWGNENGEKDVQYTLATIFGIRMLLNSLYAFTGDPEIRQLSLTLATAIAGWTGFGVPLVQSVIILSFALAETALDMKELKEGKSVPIYKSKSNWCIKPSSVTKGAVKEALGAAHSAAKTYLIDMLDKLTEETKEDFRKALNEFEKDSIEDITNAATAAILAPLQETALSLVNVVTPSRADIELRVDQAIERMGSAVNGEENSILQEAKKAAIEAFKGTYRNGLVDMIAGVQNNSGLSNEQVTGKVNDFFTTARGQLKSTIASVISPAVKAAGDSVESALDAGNEALQEKTSQALDTMLVRLNCGVSDLSDKLPEGMEMVDGGKGRTGGAAALTMNYKEYLSVFIAVSSVANEEVILKRIGNLVQANISAKSQGFDITKSYTMIELKADADLHTTFFAIPVPVSSGGSVTMGQDTYRIGYHGLSGY